MTYTHPENVIINPPSPFTGRILDLQVGGGTKLYVDEQGRLCLGLTNEKRIESIGNWMVVTNENATQGVIALDIGGGGSLLVRRKSDAFELLRADTGSADTTLGGNLLPQADATKNLGATTARWGTVYGYNLRARGGELVVEDGQGNPKARIDQAGSITVGDDGYLKVAFRGAGCPYYGHIRINSEGELSLSSENGKSMYYGNDAGGTTVGHLWFNGTSVIMELTNTGALKLEGPLAKIHGRPNVGIASNANDDLIFNFGRPGYGTVYWYKDGGGGSQGTAGTRLMRLDGDGSLWVGNPQRKVIDSQGYALYG